MINIRKKGDLMSEEIPANMIMEKVSYFMYQKMSALIADAREKDAQIVGKAINVLFPKEAKIVASGYIFEGYIKNKKYRKAIEIYNKAKRPFWHTLEAAECYEKLGLPNNTIREYEYLIREYKRISIGPFPYDLYKLGVLYNEVNTKKSKQYLEQSLSTYQDDKRFTDKHKKKAKYLLNNLKK